MKTSTFFYLASLYLILSESCLIRYFGRLLCFYVCMYAKRSSEDQTYGIGQNNQRIAQKDYNIWGKAVGTLNLEDPKQLTMLILILCGSFTMFFTTPQGKK